MPEYKYFPPDFKVTMIQDKHTKTTIIATFQKRVWKFFWKSVKRVSFDVYDYAGLGKENEASKERMEEIKRASYQYVTVSYDENNIRELWHPSNFNLEKALERHCQKLIKKVANPMSV